ncbi:chromosome partitioning protein [Micromonospora sp. WMMD998]|uniref:MinD/ParA family ATP-binding protein n=1 Tax=Micromonospora sp. WMMD998 TaxID=3016092 RepID=UPI00249CC054|nr:chromosome partitioning protein [Micromonospora sp. WMMD998]WFE37752.1 chromosome partitioning protein [Micromonospora sp. WMMD998]
MAHENDDRAHVPGGPQVPERDVEPLWPPEEIDGVVTAPPWAAPAQPAVPPWPLPPADAPAPSTQVTSTSSPQVTSTSSTQVASASEVGRTSNGGSPPQAVDVNLPFMLDQPTPDQPTPGQPAPAPPAPAPPAPAPPAAASGGLPAATAPGRLPQAAPSVDHLPAGTAPGRLPQAAPTAGRSGGPAANPDGTAARAVGVGDDVPANGRAASPWAQPPQRPTAEGTGAGTGAAEPAERVEAPARPTVPSQPTGTGTGTGTDGAGSAAYPPPHDVSQVGLTAPGGSTGHGPAALARTDTGSAGGPAANGPSTVGPTSAGPTSPGPVVGSASVTAVPLDGPTPTMGPGAPSEETPHRLGPFPPSPGVPMQQPPYGSDAAYPSPAYPPSAYPPQPGQPGWYPPGWPPQPGVPQTGMPPQPGTPPQPGVPPQAGTPQARTGPQAGIAPPAGPAPQAGMPPPAGPAPQAGMPPPAGPAQQPALPPGVYPEPGWTPQQVVPPTAEDFARRRQVRPVDPVATMGVRAVVNRMGLVRLAPGRHEQEMKRDIEMVRRNFGGLRQVTVVNPKGGAGKTVAILLLAMTFGQKRGGYVLAWDNNETQGTLGMRAQQDFHARTVRDMLRDLAQFQGPHGRVGDLSQYVRSQGEGMFDVLASDESATGGEMLTAAAFAEIREVVSRFYKLIFVDTGNNVRAQNWQAAMDATDQLVVTMSARNDSAETAARMLDHLEQSGRQRLVRQAVTVVSMPPSRKEIDLPAIQAHFAARTRAVLLAPYERLIDTGEPLRYGQLSAATRDAWLKIAASVAEGL